MTQSNINSNQWVQTPTARLNVVGLAVLVCMARGGDESALQEIDRRLKPSAEAMAAKSAKHQIGSDDEQPMDRNGMNYRHGLVVAFELIREMVFGTSSRRYTGFDSRGRPVSVEQHFRVMFKNELAELRFTQSHSNKYDRRTWKRWATIVKSHDEFDELSEAAIGRARDAVKRGDYVGTNLSISIDTFDECMKDQLGHDHLRLDNPVQIGDSDTESTYADLFTSDTFTLEPETPEGRIAREALESLGPRKQAIFERANGLTGDRETLADIGNDYGLTEQRIGQIVKACKQYIAAAVEDYRFEHGLPPLTP